MSSLPCSCLHPLEQGYDFVVLVMIDGDRDADAAQRLDLCGRLADRARYRTRLRGATRQVDRRPRRAELERDALTDAAARSCDYGDPAAQIDIWRN